MRTVLVGLAALVVSSTALGGELFLSKSEMEARVSEKSKELRALWEASKGRGGQAGGDPVTTHDAFDPTAPTVDQLTIRTPQVNVQKNGFLDTFVTLTDDQSGPAFVCVDFSQDASNGFISVCGDMMRIDRQQQSEYIRTRNLPIILSPGFYELEGVVACDRQGSCGFYNNSQFAVNGSSGIEILNDPQNADLHTPTARDGRIIGGGNLNRAVPVVRMELQGFDGSDNNTSLIEVCVGPAFDDGSGLINSCVGYETVGNFTRTLDVPLRACDECTNEVPTGTWEVKSVLVCDLASRCDFFPGDALDSVFPDGRQFEVFYQ